MRNIKISGFVCLLLLFSPVCLAENDNHVQFCYLINVDIQENTLKEQIEYFEENSIDFIVLLDVEYDYPKRIIYLVGEYQKKYDFKISLTNKPKTKSMLDKNKLLDYIRIDSIYKTNFDELNYNLYFFENYHELFDILHAENDIDDLVFSLSKDSNKAIIVSSNNWSKAHIDYLKIFQNPIQFENVILEQYTAPSAFLWFNKVGNTLLVIFGAALVLLSLTVAILRSWSMKRFQKKE